MSEDPPPATGWRAGKDNKIKKQVPKNADVLCKSRLKIELEWKPPQKDEDSWPQIDREKDRVSGMYELVREVPDKRDMQRADTDTSWRCLPDSSYDSRLQFDSDTSLTKTTKGRDYPQPRIDDIMGDGTTELIYRNTRNDDTYLVKDRKDNWGFIFQDEHKVDQKGNLDASFNPGRLSIMFRSKEPHTLDTMKGAPGERWDLTRANQGGDVDKVEKLNVSLDGAKMVKCFSNFCFVDPSGSNITQDGCFEADRSQYLVVNSDIKLDQ